MSSSCSLLRDSTTSPRTATFPADLKQPASKPKDISALPKELMLRILGFLSPKDLARASEVCRYWRVLASDPSLWNAFDLTKVFPLTILDGQVWQCYVDLPALGLSVEDAPALDRRTLFSTLLGLAPDDATTLSNRTLIPALTRLFASLRIENNAGITCLTIPKGLTLNKLVELARAPKKGNASGLSYIWDPVLQALGDTSISKTYRVAITNSVLNGSRELLVAEQQKVLGERGWEMPGMLDVATLAILTAIVHSLDAPLLYGNAPPTYTRCSDQIDGEHVVVGGFSRSGLFIDYDRYHFARDGVGGLRKLEETSRSQT